MADKNDQQTLGMLRQNKDEKTPKYHCSNCKCNRYSPCGCMKGKRAQG